MPALIQPRAGSVREVTRDVRPLAANAKVFKGGLAICYVAGPNRGFYAQGVASADAVVVGRFAESVDNTGGANGAATADIHYFHERHLFLCVNDAATAVVVGDRESPCFLLDDQTVTGAATLTGATPSARTVAGTVYDVTSEGVWVEMIPVNQQQPAPRIQTGQVTLAAGTAVVGGATGALVITAASRILFSRRLQGGTVGVSYEAPQGNRVAGGPGTGAFTVNAVSAAGALVNTDTSTLDFVVVG
jgi:hypothetical protein